jgi:16S rRNA (guanine966-N2)-methyltransferase
MANNEVRIIGGQWKGRKLKFPAVPDLRPTLGRVRETLFNWLAMDIQGARCLDLFAGSGALGFEALSRGAGEVTFVERDRKAHAALVDNLQAIGAQGIAIRKTAESFIRSDRSRYDVIFFDPPYATDPAQPLLRTLLNHHLQATGLIYLERSRRQEMPFSELLVKQSRSGDCQYGLLRSSQSIT